MNFEEWFERKWKTSKSGTVPQIGKTKVFFEMFGKECWQAAQKEITKEWVGGVIDIAKGEGKAEGRKWADEHYAEAKAEGRKELATMALSKWYYLCGNETAIENLKFEQWLEKEAKG